MNTHLRTFKKTSSLKINFNRIIFVLKLGSQIQHFRPKMSDVIKSRDICCDVIESRDILSEEPQTKEKGTFVQSLNPMTGQREWKMVPNDYDYQQEVARAAFADMLHDSERVIRSFSSCNLFSIVKALNS